MKTYDHMGRMAGHAESQDGFVLSHERYLYRGHLRIAALDMLNNMSVIHTAVWDPAEPAATRPLLLRNKAGWFTFGFDQAKNVTELFGPSGTIDGSAGYSPFGEAVTASGAAETLTRAMAWEEYVPPPPPVVVTNIIPAVWMDEDGTIHETVETNIYWNTYGGIYIPRQAEFVAPLNPFRFSSEVWDATLGLVCYHARPYNPLDGRFITRDPIEERGGLNLYGFVSNDPVNRVDWRGYLPVTVKCPDPKTMKGIFKDRLHFDLSDLTNKQQGSKTYGYTTFPIATMSCKCAKINGNKKQGIPSKWCMTCEITWTASIFMSDDLRHWPDKNLLKGAFGHEQQHVVAVDNQVKKMVVDPLSLQVDSFRLSHECNKAVTHYQDSYRPILTVNVKGNGKDERHGIDGHPVAGKLYDPLPDSTWEVIQ